MLEASALAPGSATERRLETYGGYTAFAIFDDGARVTIWERSQAWADLARLRPGAELVGVGARSLHAFCVLGRDGARRCVLGGETASDAAYALDDAGVGPVDRVFVNGGWRVEAFGANGERAVLPSGEETRVDTLPFTVSAISRGEPLVTSTPGGSLLCAAHETDAACRADANCAPAGGKCRTARSEGEACTGEAACARGLLCCSAACSERGARGSVCERPIGGLLGARCACGGGAGSAAPEIALGVVASLVVLAALSAVLRRAASERAPISA